MPFNYTKPRVPIYAMYASPGPCYALPTLTGQPLHDLRRFRAYGWIFGLKTRWMDDSCSPGPCYMLDPKIQINGRIGGPVYTLHDRVPDIPMFLTPSPAHYAPEKCGPSAFFHWPAYSLSKRLPHRPRDNNPAPNAYTLDPMIGRTIRAGVPQAPIYTMRPQHKFMSMFNFLSFSPGPAAYKSFLTFANVRRPPMWSLAARVEPPGDKTQKPAPNAHSPELHVYVNKFEPPHFSFGIRHSPYTTPIIAEPCD